jgi:hypothetical protein
MTTKYSDSYFKFLEENKDLIDSRIIQLIQTKIKPSGWESLEQYDKKTVGKLFWIHVWRFLG